jgi:hypothetical protein
MMWMFTTGAHVAREIEKLVMPLGFHVAMGGSVLHTGSSDKDLDIFLYDRSDAVQADISFVMSQIEKHLDIRTNEECKDTSVSGDRYVYRCYILNRRIDIFFLVKLLDEDKQYAKTK